MRKEYFNKRIKRLIDISEKNAAFIITNPATIYYLSGIYPKDRATLVINNNTAMLFLPFPEKKEVGNVQLKAIHEFKPTLKAIREEGVRIAGIDETSMSVYLYRRVSKFFKTMDISSMIFELRAIKDKNEIETIKNSLRYTRKLFDEIKNNVYGRREEEIERDIKIFALRNRLSISFDPIIACDKHSANVHHVPTKKTIKASSNILIDCGVRYKHYCTDITRTICNHMTKNIYANIRNIQSEIIDSIKDGSLGKDIESLYETLMKRDNFKIAHKCYHGIGLEVHEPLPEVIKKDMILCVEVGAYFPGRFGVRIEDMIRVRKNKAEVLSNF